MFSNLSLLIWHPYKLQHANMLNPNDYAALVMYYLTNFSFQNHFEKFLNDSIGNSLKSFDMKGIFKLKLK